MASNNVNLQDSFLNHVRKENIEVEVMLTSGATLQGQVKGFDNFTVVLHTGGMQHLLYKHSVAQVVAPKFQRNASPREQAPPRKAKGAAPRPPREAKPAKEDKQKFNSLDLSNIKLEEGGDQGGEDAAPAPDEKPAQA